MCALFILSPVHSRLGKWHCFLISVKHIIVPVLDSVRFLSYFYFPKAKLLIGKEAFQASSNVRSMNVLGLCHE